MGCAIWLKKQDEPQTVLSSILDNSTKLKEMKKVASQFAKPNATRDICSIILSEEE